MSLDLIRERYYLPYKLIDSYLTNKDRRQLKKINKQWEGQIDHDHFGPISEAEKCLLGSNGIFVFSTIVKFLDFEEVISLASTCTTFLKFIKTHVWGPTGDILAYREARYPVTMTLSTTYLLKIEASLSPRVDNLHISPRCEVSKSGEFLVVTNYDSVYIYTLSSLSFIGWIPVLKPFDNGCGAIEGVQFVAIFCGAFEDNDSLCSCCPRARKATNLLSVYDLKTQLLLRWFYFCGQGQAEISVNGPTIGILRYEGPIVLVHVLKLFVDDISGELVALGPMEVELHEHSLNFVALEVCNDFIVLEYVPDPGVSIVGWSHNLAGDIGLGNRACVLKLLPVDFIGQDWIWIRSGTNWMSSGSHVWSRSRSQTGGYVIRCLNLNSWTSWEIDIENMFVERVEIDDHLIAVIGTNLDGLITLELRDIDNIARGSSLKKTYTTEEYENVLGASVFKRDKMVVYNGMDNTVKTYCFKCNREPRFEDI